MQASRSVAALVVIACGLMAPVGALKTGQLRMLMRNSSAVGGAQKGCGLGEEVQWLLGKITASGSSEKPEPKDATPMYSLRTCRNLFAYKDDRDRCYKLQKRICTQNCDRLFTDANNTESCAHVKEMICPRPFPAPTSSPEIVGTGSSATTTFCNAYPPLTSLAPGSEQNFSVINEKSYYISIQHDQFDGAPDPEPFVTELKYTECQQTSIQVGEKVNIYLGKILTEYARKPNLPVASYVGGSDNAIVMLGQHTLGHKEMALALSTFRDEGQRRPILCSAYPEPHIEVEVMGRNWHPFSDAEHPSALKYMECEKLALDHADSLHHLETLDFYEGDLHMGELDVRPSETIFVVGMVGRKGAEHVGENGDFQVSSYDFGNLHSQRKPKKPVRGPYDRLRTSPASRK